MFEPIWITEDIAVSAAFLEEDIHKIKQAGIDAIIDVRSEYSANRELIEGVGMQFLHLDVDDRYAPTQEQLRKIFDFALPLLEQGKKILVHCQNGYGRSPLVAVAIMVKRGLSVADAVRILEDRHPAASFTPQQEGFIYSLNGTKS